MMKWFKNLATPLTRKETPELHTTRLDDFLQAARQAQYDEQYDETLRWLLQAEDLVNAPTHPAMLLTNLQLNRADVYIYQQEYEAAKTLLNDIIEVSESHQYPTSHAYALCSMGVIAQKTGNWQQAREHYENALELATSDKAEGAMGRASGHLGDVYVHDNNLSYGIHLYRQAIPALQQSGDTLLLPYFMLQLGDALLETHQYAEGEVMLLRGLERARTMQHRLFGRELSLRIGARAYEKGDYDHARRHYENAIQLMPQPLPATSRTLEALLRLNVAAGAGDEMQIATRSREQALKLLAVLDYPADKAAAHFLLGENYLHTSEHSLAKVQLQQAVEHYEHLESDQTLVKSLCYLAGLQDALAEGLALFDRAQQHATELDLVAAGAQIQADKGDFYRLHYHISEAIAAWQQALAYYTPQQNHHQIARYHARIALGQLWLGRGKQAQRSLEKALMHTGSIEILADKAEILFAAAQIYTATGQVESAESFYQDVIGFAKKLNNVSLQARYRAYYGAFLVMIHDIQPALLELHEVRLLCDKNDLTSESLVVQDAMARAYRLNENIPEALRQHEQIFSRLDKLQDTIDEARFRLNYAQTLLVAGRLAEIPVLLKEIEQTGRQYHHAPLVTEVLLIQATRALQQTGITDAGTYLDEVAALIGYLQQPFLEMFYQKLRHQYLTRTGDNSEAQVAENRIAVLRKTLQIHKTTVDD